MKEKPIVLHILLWCEIIVAARVLVFTIPVLSTKYAKGSVNLVGIEGWTLIVMTLIALYYLATGLASVLKIRGWQLFHYLGTVLTAALIFSLAKKIFEIKLSVSYLYFIPVAVSLGLSLAVLFMKERKETLT